jgi:hypothetical protein
MLRMLLVPGAIHKHHSNTTLQTLDAGCLKKLHCLCSNTHFDFDVVS